MKDFCGDILLFAAVKLAVSKLNTLLEVIVIFFRGKADFQHQDLSTTLMTLSVELIHLR